MKSIPVDESYPIAPNGMLNSGCRAGEYFDGILVRCEGEPEPCPVTVHVTN